MSNRGDYDELIGTLREAEGICKELVDITKRAERKAGEIDEYATRLVGGEIYHLVVSLEGFACSEQKIGSIPYMISRLERHLQGLG